MNALSDTRSAGLPARMHVGRSDDPLRIAIVYSREPFPMMRGDQLTVSHLISYLAARGHKVDLLHTPLDGERSAEQDAWLRTSCAEVLSFPHGRIDKVKGLLAAMLRMEPLQVGLFRNARLTSALKRRLDAGLYDIVYCYYLRSAAAIPAFPVGGTRMIGGRRMAGFLAMQLSQTLNTRRIAENADRRAQRLLYRFETWLIQRYEARVWQRFTRSVLIGPKDVDAVRDACLAEGQPEISNWVYGAHGTDVRRFRAATPAEVVPNRIVFSGSMLYQPNIQAVLWFAANCWDVIRARHPDAEWYIVGRDPVREVLDLNGTRGITVTGTVEDVGAHIRAAAVCINPMLAAGGMQNKLIEYLACGKAVVASPVANEGIRAPDGTVLKLAESAGDFATAVLDLLADRTRATAMGAAARAYVLENWTWEAHFETLEQNFHAALSADAEPAFA